MIEIAGIELDLIHIYRQYRKFLTRNESLILAICSLSVVSSQIDPITKR